MTEDTLTATASTVRLSVGELVAFACRSGDLVTSMPSGPSAQEGIRAHRKLQKQRPEEAEAEYPLAVTVTAGECQFLLGGRVDILHPQTDLHRPVQLDEIKTTYCPPEQLSPNQKALHWAQLKIYGFCYCEQQRQAGVTVERLALQMLWYNLKEKKVYRQLQTFSAESLVDFAGEALARYATWWKQWQSHQARLLETAKALAFPFPAYRAGQREMAVAVYRTLRDARQLVVEAPTGIGKTISSLYPTIKAIGEGLLDRAVYLTAKNSGRQAVRDAVNLLRNTGLSLSLLVIQARDKTCACRTGDCALDADGLCPRTRGFYDRLPAARCELLDCELMTPEQVARVAAEHQVCPFELSLEMLPWADLVVCDFNYVFDPLVNLSGVYTDSRRTALLVDEAHNLGERGRAMYTAAVVRSEIRRAARACKVSQPPLCRTMESLQRALSRWAQRVEGESAILSLEAPEQRPQGVARAVNRLLETLTLLAETGSAYPDEMGDWLKTVYRYACIDQLAQANHRSLTRVRPMPGGARVKNGREISLQLLCLDAGDYLAERYREFQAVVFFSATLRPPAYICRQLGLTPEVPYLALPSPFQARQLGGFVCPYVDTRYRQRASAIAPIVDLVIRVYQARRGNYLVFFPSYQFMQQVVEHFQTQYPEVPLVVQQAGASEAERADFLQRFNAGESNLGFAIMGGIFGEGIDYLGERLVGAVVIGVGLPQVGDEQELLRQVCEQRGDNGFDFAYRYPGMTRVLQTAGRVIRSEEDRGILVLVDNRFAQPFYRHLYPEWWQLRSCENGEQLSAGLSAFWQLPAGSKPTYPICVNITLKEY